MNTRILLIAAATCLGTFISHAELAVDRYGQYTGEEWPGKITSDDQLRADAEKEWPLIKDAKFDPAHFDRFGGRLDAGKFEATGRFYTKKIDGRWWLITPEGNRYFIIGCDAVGYNENGYASPLNNPDGSMRNVFAELPDTKRVPDGLARKKVNLLAANLEKKYGSNYYEKSKEVNRKRLISWGFNSTAKWGWGETFDLPYVEDCNFHKAKKLPDRRIDFYDPAFPTIAEDAIKELTKCRNGDPMLIAYSTENENGWSHRDVILLTAATPETAAKQALIDFLIKRHGEEKAAQLFGVTDGRKGMLNNQTQIELPLKDRADFVTKSSRYYHQILANLFRKYAPDHLWFGASYCGNQSPEWIYAAAEFTDAVMLNEYHLLASWSKRLMPRLTELDKPVFITEYSFVCESRGFPTYNSFNTVRDELSRGLAYRFYAEQMAATPLCIGFGYFIFFDQPVTRRSLPNGESYNFGLVNYTDQPYYEMLTEIKKANSNLEAIHAGEQKAFSLDNPQALLMNNQIQELLSIFLPNSASKFIVPDISISDYFGGCQGRLKIGEHELGLDAKAPERHSIGTIYAGDNSLFGNIKADVYFWKNHRGKDLNDYYELEGSQDNLTFKRLPLRFELKRQLEFDHYAMTNAEPIPGEIRYLRIVLKAPVASQSWSNQIANIVVER